MQMGAAEMGKRFEQHFINYQNTKAIRESIVYLYTTPSMQLPTNSQRSSLDRLRLLLLHRTKMRIQSPCQPSTMKHPKNRRSSTYQIHSERRREGDATQTQRSCGKRIHRDREEIAQHSRNLHAKMYPNQETKKRGSRPLCMRRFDDLFCGDWEVSTFVSRMMIDQCRKRSNAQCL